MEIEMTEDRRLTQQDIAERAGVTRATVSMALRDSPRIGAATRERVQQLAEELGYRPDPNLSALAAYRNRGQRREQAETLAVASVAHETPAVLDRGWDRAGELGYRPESIAFEPSATGVRNMLRILRARGIRGVILRLAGREIDHLIDADAWRGLSVVALSGRPWHRNLHTVAINYYHSAFEAVRRMAELGYARPGLWVHPVSDRRSDGLWARGFEEGCRVFYDGRAGKVARPKKEAALLGEKIACWVRERRLDSLLIAGTGSIFGEVKAAGLRVPEDCGFAVTDAEVGPGKKALGMAGLVQPRQELATVAVEALDFLLHQNRSGRVPTARTTLVQAPWVDGASLPPR